MVFARWLVVLIITFAWLVGDTFLWEGNQTVRICIDGGGDITAQVLEGNGYLELWDWQKRDEGEELQEEGLEERYFWKVKVIPMGWSKVEVDTPNGVRVGLCPEDELKLALGADVTPVLAFAGVISGTLWALGLLYVVKTT
jgi:hypothetical protein